MALNLNIYKRIKDLNAKTTLSDSDFLVSDNSSELASAKITFLNLCNQLLQKLKIGALSTSGYYINGESVAHDLNALDTQLHNTDGSISNKVSNVSYTDTGILQETINGTNSNVMVTDSAPTENSVNPIQSGAVYTELDAITDNVSDIETAIGDITDLDTTATDLVGGINEVKGTADKAVQYTSQSLTDAQKTQARTNILAQKSLGLYIDANGDICQE